MRIGLLADVHEEPELLKDAISALQAARADRIIFLGDLVGSVNRARLQACARLMSNAAVEGVWGNHDLGLCYDPDPNFLGTFPAEVAELTTRLNPRLEVNGVMVCHVPPVIDVTDGVEFGSFKGKEDTVPAIMLTFAAFPNRVFLCGHAHRWLAFTPAGPRPWNGTDPISLAGPERYFIVVHAVVDGWTGVLDTDDWMLTPIRIAQDSAM